MQIGTFRKNVMKTAFSKQAKLGMRVVSKSTQRTNIVHATVAMKAHTGHLIQALSQYMLGLQLTQEMKSASFTAMGDIGYDLTLLCRNLKVKMPASTKKSKLVGTRSAALLALDGLTTDLLALVEVGTFTGPKMVKVKKIVVLPNKGGIKEEREVSVVDAEAEGAMETDRQNKMKSLLSGVVDVYWRLSFEMFQHPPVTILADKFTRLQQAYPDIEFDTGEKAPQSVPVPAVAVPAPVVKAKAVKKSV